MKLAFLGNSIVFTALVLDLLQCYKARDYTIFRFAIKALFYK